MAVAWFRRRQGSGPAAERVSSDLEHLENFVRTRVGVEAYLEPKTTVTEPTIVLIANDGEWTRRRVPSHQHARAWGNRLGIPVYDVALTGYPNRMREYNQRRKAASE
jgi:hypothetical protein